MNKAFLTRDENLRLQAKANKKKRNKKGRILSGSASTRHFKYTGRLRSLFSNELKILEANGFIDKRQKTSAVSVPRYFSFKDNFDQTIVFFKQLISSFIYGKDVIVDFTNCEHSDISAFSVFNLVYSELETLLSKYNLGLYNRTNKDVQFKTSKKDGKTNKYLHAFNYHNLEKEFQDDSSYLPLDLFKGKRRSSFRENLKSAACSRIVRFVFDSLLGAGQKPDAYDIDIQNPVEGYVSEVLNNAEDHSPNGTEWFVNGISFREVQHETNIVEFNLSIINFGQSMYEGFEKTKELNNEQYKTLENLFAVHERLFTPFNKFTRESLFTLYMLNETISRLKYEDESRGHGTMNFIESFIKLGKLGDTNSYFTSVLNIVSGHTRLSCDNRYKPYKEGDMRVISLNKSNNIKLLPDNKYLRTETEYFPGTILECKIYFEHINNG